MDGKLFFLGFMVVMMTTFVMAESYVTVDEFMGKIPQANDALKSEELILPDAVAFLISNGNILVNISMIDGSSRSFYFTVEEKVVTGIFSGQPEKYSYVISTTESTCNEIIKSEDKMAQILSNYDNKNITIKAKGFGSGFKLFLAKIFIRFV